METERLSTSVYQGVRWSAAARYGDQLVRLMVTIVLVRMLDPADFGLLGMALVATGLLAVIRSGGLSEAVIQRQELSETLACSLHWASIGNSLLLWAALCLFAPAVAWMFGAPRLVALVIVMGLTNVITATGLVPAAMLTRKLAFKKLALAEFAGAVAYGVVAIVSAATGARVWALVWGNLACTLTIAGVLNLSGDWRPRWHFSWREVRSVARFGAGLTGFQVFNYLSRRSDDLVIGLFLGPGPLGIYKLGYRILLAPLMAVSEVLGRVMFPVLARSQQDDERVRRLYLRACAGVALATFPMMTGLLAVTDPLVVTLFGAKWLAVIPVLKIFAPVSMAQALVATTGQIYLAKGRTDRLLQFGIGAGLVQFTAFLIGVQWGIVGVATALAVATALLAWPTFAIPFSLVRGLTVRDLLQTVSPALLAATLMATAVYGLRIALATQGVSAPWQLVCCVPVGIGLYTLLVSFICPATVSDVRQLAPAPKGLKKLFARDRAKNQPELAAERVHAEPAQAARD